MGQGTNGGGSSEGSGGGGMGMGLLGSLFGGGGSNNSQVAQQAYSVDNPGLMTQIRQGLSDPKTMQSLGSTMQQLGKTIGAANDIPAPAAQMLKQVMNQSQPVQRISGLGDMPAFSPTEANSILQNMGISVGGNSNIRGGGGGFSVPFGSAPAAPPPMPTLPNPARY